MKRDHTDGKTQEPNPVAPPASPPHPEQMKKAWQAFDDGNYPLARQLAEKAIEKEPSPAAVEDAKDLLGRMKVDRISLAAWAICLAAWIAIISLAVS